MLRRTCKCYKGNAYKEQGGQRGWNSWRYKFNHIVYYFVIKINKRCQLFIFGYNGTLDRYSPIWIVIISVKFDKWGVDAHLVLWNILNLTYDWTLAWLSNTSSCTEKFQHFVFLVVVILTLCNGPSGYIILFSNIYNNFYCKILG